MFYCRAIFGIAIGLGFLFAGLLEAKSLKMYQDELNMERIISELQSRVDRLEQQVADLNRKFVDLEFELSIDDEEHTPVGSGKKKENDDGCR